MNIADMPNSFTIRRKADLLFITVEKFLLNAQIDHILLGFMRIGCFTWKTWLKNIFQ